MKSFTRFSVRFAAYLLVLGYLAGDLYFFNGPLSRRIKASDPNSPESIAEVKANGVVARVFNHHITRSQLDRAIHDRLWLEGKSVSNLTPNERNLVEYAALGELIDHQLLRVKVKVNSHELEVSDEEINTRLKRFVEKFPSAPALTDAMKSQGIPDERALRNRIAARIQQEKYVAMRVDPLVEVSEEEITDFYENNKSSLRVPERIRARHIFAETLDTPSEEARKPLESALTQLVEGTKDFSTLAQELSNDPATGRKGGDLGWMSRSRLPDDFTESVFHLPMNTPTLVRTKLGWHIVEVTDRKAAEMPSIANLEEEIRTAIKARKRHQAVNDFRSALRRFEEKKIDIFHDQLAR